MKLPEKEKLKKQKMKKKSITKPKKEKVLVVAQEFKFARLLSGNEKKTRDRVLKMFKKWLLNCFEKGYEFKEDDFIRVWKGLFYAVWMSDKPLVQEDLCDSISEILDLFPPEQISGAIMMSKAGFKVLATEWYGIDQHRMDKFLMLVRRYLRGSFRCLLRCKWSLDSCKQFSDMLTNSDGLFALQTPLYARNALSMVLHITDCYLEELSKVSKGVIPDDSMVQLLQPFCALVAGARDGRGVAARRLLTALMRQSDLGLQYDSKARAWQKMGCPAGGPDALELVSDDEADDEEHPETDDEDTENGPLDPRAGRVHVRLRPLPAPARALAAELRRLLPRAASHAHARARLCAERFEELARNNYPLKVPEAEAQGLEPNLDRAEPMRAASRLQKLEKTLVTASDELALRGLSRKHRKRLLAKSRAGVSLVDEQSEASESTNGDWQVETTQPDRRKKNESNKENKEGKKKKNRKRKHQKDENVAQENNKKQKTDKHTNNEKTKIKTDEKVVNDKKEKSNTNEKQKSKTNTNQNNKKPEAKDKSKKDKKPTEDPTKVLSIKIDNKTEKSKIDKSIKNEKKDSNKKKMEAKLIVNKVKNYQKQTSNKESAKATLETPKKVKFVLKKNSAQGPVDYYQSVRRSPSIPFDGSRRPSKTNLKPSTASPINPFMKKFKLKN